MKLIVLKNNVPLSEVSVDTSDSSEMYEIYVGRSEDCHVQIDDPLISRHHFVLKNEGQNWVCEKLTQLGAVILNGSLVTKNVINNGDEVKCGMYSIIVAELTTLRGSGPPPETMVNYAPPVQEQTHTMIMPQSRPAPKPEPVEEEGLTSLPEEDLGTGIGSFDESAESVESPDESTEEVSQESSDGLNFSDDNGSTEDFNAPVESSDFAPVEGEDSFGMEPVVNEEHETTRVFKAFVNYQLVLFGEHAPYDRFQLDQDEIFIGRDNKKCQIVLNDPEVSSVHAVVRKNGNDVTLEDLNSSNGTILNGERINKAHVATGDEFVIGGTSFSLEVRSDLLDTESDRLMPVETGQFIETEEEIEEVVSAEDADLNFSEGAPVEKSIIKRIMKDPKLRFRAIIGVVAFLGLLLWLDETPEENTQQKKPKAKEAKVDPNAKPKKVLSKDLETRRNVAYELGVTFFEQSKYFEALREFQTVIEIDPEYKKIQSYFEQTKVGLKRLEEIEAQRRAEEERIKTKKLIEELLVKAREAVKDKNVTVAESYFSQITEKDPENIEVQQLKLELESWQKEQERKALELAAKEAARKKMVDSLAPGKTFYLKKEWYRAILKLEEFLRIKGVDEDLIKEGSDMLSDAKNQLASELGPLLGKARSFKEGQDLKSAYEAFLEILKVEPTNSEALNEVDDIRSQLDARSKKIYREAIIAESLSLFGDAKEKFQEVQQISPTDSEYYKKASEKLRNYLE
ncbi:FHA domain-containing protein [Peredibacter starrii]|uniref:FHA domain-containing protein n=1 Tax=Peredibacter starrii TaxID=28202 RepID=A0AAX4HPV7_9BACT|nr:FHA domain-containing protein [Peredibacter starrii]WPU65198.1 FHA domain-containing protein [Peredibacter starrii]